MPKMMKKRDYIRWINQYGWTLERAGGGDWKLHNAHGNIAVRNIIVTHPGNEIPPISIKKTRLALQTAGLE